MITLRVNNKDDMQKVVQKNRNWETY